MVLRIASISSLEGHYSILFDPSFVVLHLEAVAAGNRSGDLEERLPGQLSEKARPGKLGRDRRSRPSGAAR